METVFRLYRKEGEIIIRKNITRKVLLFLFINMTASFLYHGIKAVGQEENDIPVTLAASQEEHHTENLVDSTNEIVENELRRIEEAEEQKKIEYEMLIEAEYNAILNEQKTVTDIAYDKFLEFINVHNEYAPLATIYTEFTDEELELLFRIVEAEVTGTGCFTNKVNVANVIFNRYDNNFGTDLVDILTADNQFSTYGSGRYNRITVTEETIRACEYAFLFDDTTQGSLWFASIDDCWASRNRQEVFTDSCGHTFYK